MKKTYYNEDIIRGLEEWGEMRERRMKGEISDQEYIEWKLNYNLYSQFSCSENSNITNKRILKIYDIIVIERGATC